MEFADYSNNFVALVSYTDFFCISFNKHLVVDVAKSLCD